MWHDLIVADTIVCALVVISWAARLVPTVIPSP
jgi:hypothetical protein